MVSLDFAFQLDQALKQAVARAYVIYNPPYRDLRGATMEAGYEIWVSDPDDEAEAVRYFSSDKPSRLGKPVVSPKRLAKLADTRRSFAAGFKASQQEAPLAEPATVESEGRYQGIRVDALTAAEVAQKMQEDDKAAAARTWRDAETAISRDVLAEAVTKRLKRRLENDWFMRLSPDPFVLPAAEVFGDPLPLAVYKAGFAEAFAAHSVTRFAPLTVVPDAYLQSGVITDQDAYAKLELPFGTAYLVQEMRGFQPMRKELDMRLLIPNAAAFYRWLGIPAAVEGIGDGWQWAEQEDGTIQISPKEVPIIERQGNPFDGYDAGPANQDD